MTSICNQIEAKYPYYVKVAMNVSSSGNIDSCWMRCDNSLTTSNVTDLSFVLSENESLATGIIRTVVCIPGIILNVLVLLAILRNPNLRKEYITPSIASIAMTDFLFAVYCLRIASYYIRKEVNFREGCEVFGIFTFGLWMVSIFNLIGIAGLRCFALNCPRKTKSKCFQYSCRIVPIMAWILTLTIFLPTLTGQYGRNEILCKIFLCSMINVDTEDKPIFPGPMAFYLIIIAFSGILLFLLNILSYVQVSRHSKKIFDKLKDTSVEEATKVLKNEKKLQKMVGLIAAAFLFVYVPLVLLMAYPNVGFDYPIIGIIAFSCSYLLVVIDPLVYIYSSEKYRNAIKSILDPIVSRISTLNQTHKLNHTSELTNISQSHT